MTRSMRNFVDSWAVLALAAGVLLALSLGGVRAAEADSHEGGALMSVGEPAAAAVKHRSVEAKVGESDQCQAGPAGEANLRAEYERKMAAVRARLAEHQRANGSGGVITLNARGHNYGPAPTPSLPLDLQPPAKTR